MGMLTGENAKLRSMVERLEKGIDDHRQFNHGQNCVNEGVPCILLSCGCLSDKDDR